MRYSIPVRTRKLLWIGGSVLGFLLLDAAALLWLMRVPPAPALQFSRATTYILAPRDRDGLPDYRGYLRGQQLGSHPDSSNALLDLHAALGSATFGKHSRSWAAAELGLREGIDGELIRPEAYARTACGEDHSRCQQLLDAARQTSCTSLSGEALELATAWVAINQGALESIRRASERPVLYVPLDERASSSLSPVAVIQAQRALACDAAIRHRDNAQIAADDVVALWKLSALLLRDQNLILGMVGLVGIGIGCPIARELSRDAALPAETAERLLRSIPVLDERASLIAMVNRERIAALLVAQNTVRSRNSQDAGSLPKLLARSRVVDPGAVLRRVNTGFDLLERAANAPTADARSASLARALDALKLRSHRRPSAFEALSCQLSATRRWCTLDQHVADLIVWRESAGYQITVRKLSATSALIEDTRRALVAAQARP